jgi:lipoprotein-anchoring transpeptidase ErfK/SrfK
MRRRLLLFSLVSLAAAGSAWWASERELLGARPVWSPAAADYSKLEAVAPPARPLPAAEGVGPGPADEKPQAKDPGAPAVPPRGDEAAREAGKPGAAQDPRFPPGERPVGLDPFLRSAVQEIRIEAGDTLGKIARRHSVPVQLLVNLNGIEPEKILAGAKLQVVRGPFHVLVLRDRRVLRLYAGGVFVQEYGVATGKPGHETRTGDFKVQSKIMNPSWTNPETHAVVPFGEPENPLGTRWMGFTEGLGLHGTWENESIGKAASSGCIRMRNEDVEELFDLLVIGESAVRIVEDLPAAPGKPAAADDPREEGQR